jgi:hypothetical protein
MEFRARGAWGRKGRLVANAELMEEVRTLQARLETMEAGRQRDLEAGDISENEEMAAPTPESAEIRMLRSVLCSSFRPKPELPTYDGSLTAENLIDWTSELDKYSDYEEIEELKR